MPKTKPPYPAEFRRQMVELAMAGRMPAELSREFDCSAQTIINWVARAASDSGKSLPGKDVLSTAEREELARLRRQVAPAADGARRPGKGYGLVCRKSRQDVHAVFKPHEREPGHYPVHAMCRALSVSANGY